MIFRVACRQGRLLATKRSPSIPISGLANSWGGGGGGSSAATARQLPAALLRVETTAATALQQQFRSLSVASGHLLAAGPSDKPSRLGLPLPSFVPVPARSYHVSAPARKEQDVKTLEETASEISETVPESHHFKALTPALRDAIVADLRSVDADGNGKIDADELKVLLRKYKGSFCEAEVVELGDLFYSSLGASAVDINRFVEALDAAAAEKGTSGGGETEDGEVTPLAAKGKFKTHPLGIGTCASEYMYSKTHGKYEEEDLNIKITHIPPESFSDRTALWAVKIVKVAFDTATLWNVGAVTRNKILYRAIFLETIAAIPGMVAAILRHFKSLRHMSRDGGLLNMFLEEANNERMHLLTFIHMKSPGRLFRAAVLVGQAGFATFFMIAYMISPKWCHRFVGYVEEEACITYTKILQALDEAPEHTELGDWRDAPAPKFAKGYWHLGEEGTIYDVMRAVRADEAEHRDVNHSVSGAAEGTVNPLYDPREKLDGMLKKYVKDIMAKEAAGDHAKMMMEQQEAAKQAAA